MVARLLQRLRRAIQAPSIVTIDFLGTARPPALRSEDAREARRPMLFASPTADVAQALKARANDTREQIFESARRAAAQGLGLDFASVTIRIRSEHQIDEKGWDGLIRQHIGDVNASFEGEAFRIFRFRLDDVIQRASFAVGRSKPDWVSHDILEVALFFNVDEAREKNVIERPAGLEARAPRAAELRATLEAAIATSRANGDSLAQIRKTLRSRVEQTRDDALAQIASAEASGKLLDGVTLAFEVETELDLGDGWYQLLKEHADDVTRALGDLPIAIASFGYDDGKGIPSVERDDTPMFFRFSFRPRAKAPASLAANG
jgi:hypothetical protein